MDVKYQVFVSSTYNDLKDERFAVINCLLDNNCIPVGMEQFHAVPMKQWDYITKMLDNSDYCVLILAGKYGSIEESSGIGYTEKEFDYAIANNIPVIRLLYKDLEFLKVNQSETDAVKKEKLLAFRAKAEKDSLADYYESIEDLKNKVSIAIHKAIKNCPRLGWIRRTSTDTEEHFTEEDVAKVFSNNSPTWLSEEKIRQLIDNEFKVRTATDEEVQEMPDKIFGKNNTSNLAQRQQFFKPLDNSILLGKWWQ